MVWVSVFGIVTLVMLARALGFAAQPRLADAQQAAAIAAHALTGFRASGSAVDDAGRAALVRAADGRIALIRPHGDRWVVRVANGAATTLADGRLTVRLAEPMFAPVALDLGPDAAEWARALGA